MVKKIDYNKEAIKIHKKLKGKISIISKQSVTKNNLSTLYTPGVAEPCRIIAKDEDKSYELTSRWNMISVISDGSAVLGLGNIGPYAAMPVMEGKCILFKEFAGVDAFPICIDTQDTKKIIEHVSFLEPSLGGINLEDISAPRCFEIEKALKKKLSIPVFHDDQHGTAVVVLAGLVNALKLTNRHKENTKIVVNGAGAAGTAVTEFLMSFGFKDIIVCDKDGVLPKKNVLNKNKHKIMLGKKTNPRCVEGLLENALNGADVFIGVSVGNVLTEKMVKKMNKNPIIFALANPTPEIFPNVAKKCGVKYMATGRSDFANQVNNVLAFPGIMRGALAVRAKDINEEMKHAASLAISSMIPDNKLRANYFIPKAYDKNIGPIVAKMVAGAAMKSNVARIKRRLNDVENETKRLINAKN